MFIKSISEFDSIVIKHYQCNLNLQCKSLQITQQRTVNDKNQSFIINRGDIQRKRKKN